jgi:hypothetical protein
MNAFISAFTQASNFLIKQSLTGAVHVARKVQTDRTTAYDEDWRKVTFSLYSQRLFSLYQFCIFNFIIVQRLFNLPSYTLAGFDLMTHNSTGIDDTIRPRRCFHFPGFALLQKVRIAEGSLLFRFAIIFFLFLMECFSVPTYYLS